MLKLTCPRRDQPARGARLGARPARLDRGAARPRRAGRAVRAGRDHPDRRPRHAHRLGRRRAAHAAPGRRRAALRRARARASRGGSSRSSSAARSRPCRREVAEFAAAAGVSASRGQRRRRRHALGQLLVAGADSPELAADPRAARSAALRRRARGRAPRPPQPRARVQGARGAAVRARRRRGEGGATARRAAAAADRPAALTDSALAAAAAAAAAAGGGCGCGCCCGGKAWSSSCWVGSPVPSGPDHRLRLRIAGLAAAACRAACRSRRPSAACALASIARVAVHLFFRRQLPVGHRHLGLELLDRAVGDGDGHEIVEGARRRGAALQPGDRRAHRRGPSTRRSSARSKSR